MSDIRSEWIAKAADVLDSRRHNYDVNALTWRPYCICGWSAEEPYDVAAYDRHLAVAVLEAVADDIRAEGAVKALREAADEWGAGAWQEAWLADAVEDDVSAVRSTVAWLRDRANEIEGEQQ